MTTDRQREANRRNATKSTGPRTAAGKVASSNNARRHGLTAALDPDMVLSWYRLLVEDDTAVLDPFEQDPYRRAAADLARAEAHLQRVQAAEEQWLKEGVTPLSDDPDLVACGKSVRDMLVEEAWMGRRPLRVPWLERRLLPAKLPPSFSDERLDILEAFVDSPAVEVGWDRMGWRLLRRIDQAIVRDREVRQVAQAKRGRALAGYRAAAEVRRLRALARWSDHVAASSSHLGRASKAR